jgi:DNA-binding SARP family transcriptional activator
LYAIGWVWTLLPVRFGVLGPLEVRANGAALALGGRKQQIVLALLAVNAGQLVSVEGLVDELWPDDPPPSAVANVRGYAGRLRRLFTAVEPGADRLVGRGDGFVLHVEPDELDLSIFTARAAAAREALRRQDFEAAARQFSEAKSLWRGQMLMSLPLGPALAARRAVADEERLAVVEDLAASRLGLGDHAETTALLREHVRLHPLRERGHLLFVRALHGLGDVSGALAAYAHARTVLVKELGIEPGPELQDLHRAVLNRDADPALAVSHGGRRDPADAGPEPGRQVPAQLPLEVFGFTGRGAELAALDSVLAAADDQPTAVVISAIAGTAGVGKTALAVHWAQRVREQFPDGQLYVNLRGFDPSGSPLEPAEAIRGFLDALQVPVRRIPTDLAAQAALYRSLLTNRRLLILLDNARDTDQVRPLLPGSPGCLVVVTSRNTLMSLVAAEGAHPVMLDLLIEAEARDLLARRLGTARVTADPGAVDEIITRCARLPLALAIAAARAATRPDLDLEALAAELREARGVLGALDTGDSIADVRAVFSWSYQTLGGDAARLFRLLSLHPGPDASAPAVASLAGLPLERASAALTELTRANLLSENIPGRYAFHDLLRAYTTELVNAYDPGADRRAATDRMFDHYLHTAHAAEMLVHPQRWNPISLPPVRPKVKPDAFGDDQEATTWFATEHAVLLAVIRRAIDNDFDGRVWQLAWTFMTHLERGGHWDDRMSVAVVALRSAQQSKDLTKQAHAHRSLGHSYEDLGDDDNAQALYQQALEMFSSLGDHVGRAQTHVSLCMLLHRRGDVRQGLHHSEQALDLFRLAGDRSGEAYALNNIAVDHADLGDYLRALSHCEQALAVFHELGDRWGQACAWDSLGDIHRHLGHFDRAVDCYGSALTIVRQLGDRYYEAVALVHLGDVHTAAHDVDAARIAWEEALDILDELGHPEAKDVRSKLQSTVAG